MTARSERLDADTNAPSSDLNISDRLHRAGLPPLDRDAGRVGFFEFWPMWLFYAPVPFYWAGLSVRYGSVSLPTAANPALPYGGLMGESKIDIFDRLTGDVCKVLPRSIRLIRDAAPIDRQLSQARAALQKAEIGFPLVAKPDMGCRGVGVQLLHDDASLARYLDEFPVGAALVLQELIDLEGEAGVMYRRAPGEKSGRITSLTLKYFPYVEGDGVRTLKELIMADPRAGRVPHLYLPRHRSRLNHIIPAGELVRLSFAGSHSKGAIFRDGGPFITDEMTRAFDAIADQIDGLHLVRFDVRFGDFAAFQRGDGFRIIEINGAGAETTHIWDSRTKLLDAWAAVLGNWRQLFAIGALNRRRGHRPEPLLKMIKVMWNEARLSKTYPESH